MLPRNFQVYGHFSPQLNYFSKTFPGNPKKERKKERKRTVSILPEAAPLTIISYRLSPLSSVQQESHFKREPCRMQFQPRTKVTPAPQHFSWGDEGEGTRAEQGAASRAPGRAPSCTLISEPAFCSHKKNVKDLPKYVAPLPARTKEKQSSWSGMEFWRYFEHSC